MVALRCRRKGQAIVGAVDLLELGDVGDFLHVSLKPEHLVILDCAEPGPQTLPWSGAMLAAIRSVPALGSLPKSRPLR
jgi:hypothetical protein